MHDFFKKQQAALRTARQRMVKLLPQSAAKTGVQLPIPQTPFDRYRRQKLIRLLNLGALAEQRTVLEIGCGVGDLLAEVSKFGPRQLYGVDSSEEMIGLARQYLTGVEVDLSVANVRALPFPEKAFDLVVVMSELQHILEDEQAEEVVAEVCRVARQWVVLVEDTDPDGDVREGYVRRPVDFYKKAFKQHTFYLRSVDVLEVAASKYVFTGRSNPWHWLRWLFSPLLYLMGFSSSYLRPPTQSTDLPDSEAAMNLQEWTLPLMSGLDEVFRTAKGTTVMRFERERLFRR